MSKKTLFFDTETRNAGSEYGHTPEEHMRLFQYAWGNGPVQQVRDYADMVSLVREADYVVGHNIISYDLRVMFPVTSLEPLEMALRGKVIDTFVLATLLSPAPYSYTDRNGHTYYDAAAPERAKKWLSLDNLCHQFGIPGKFLNLDELAKKYNPPKTKKADLDYGLIDWDDPDAQSYADQDVIANRDLYHYFIDQIKVQGYNRDYIWREMIVWSLNAQMEKNGVRVNIVEAQDRVQHLLQERDTIMEWLVGKFGFPTTGAQPWKSAAGKQAILDALKLYGITPSHPNWTKTANGAPSFGGDVMKSLTEGTEAQKLGESLATLMGQRSLAQLALESVKEDGKAHPSILCLQRSGRTSVTRPGLTIWTAKCKTCGKGVCDHPESGTVEKRYFLPDEGHRMVSLDFSSADARAMAALSGDAEYAVQFEMDENGKPKYDSHNLMGEASFGKDVYWEGVPEGTKKPPLRDPSKIISHSANYNVGARTLADGMNKACEKEGLDLRFTVAEAKTMLNNMNRKFRLLKRFKDRVVEQGVGFGYVESPWGRRMKVDVDREYTQGPGLVGQNVTRERIYDGLIKIAYDNIECIRWVRFPVHDEVVLSIPVDDCEWGVPYFQKNMSGIFDPRETSKDWHTGQPIEFFMSAGEPETDWHKSGH